jgi:thiamine pyrophosphate-dependent acetolactate synthase large subunit-like protein
MNAQPSKLALNTVEPSVAPIGRMLIASAIMTIALPKVAGVRRIKAPFPEDHDLYAWPCGDMGSIPGNASTREADVLLAIGTKFSDRITSSYRRGVTFNIPPKSLPEPNDFQPFDLQVSEEGNRQIAPIIAAVAAAEQNCRCPTIELKQALGFSLWMARAVLNGRGDEIIDLAKTNLIR